MKIREMPLDDIDLLVKLRFDLKFTINDETDERTY